MFKLKSLYLELLLLHSSFFIYHHQYTVVAVYSYHWLYNLHHGQGDTNQSDDQSDEIWLLEDAASPIRGVFTFSTIVSWVTVTCVTTGCRMAGSAIETRAGFTWMTLIWKIFTCCQILLMLSVTRLCIETQWWVSFQNKGCISLQACPAILPICKFTELHQGNQTVNSITTLWQRCCICWADTISLHYQGYKYTYVYIYHQCYI